MSSGWGEEEEGQDVALGRRSAGEKSTEGSYKGKKIKYKQYKVYQWTKQSRNGPWPTWVWPAWGTNDAKTPEATDQVNIKWDEATWLTGTKIIILINESPVGRSELCYRDRFLDGVVRSRHRVDCV